MNRSFVKIEFSADQVSVATNPYAAGLPSLTAVSGMVEALRVTMIKMAGKETYCDSFAFGLRDCQAQFRGGGRHAAYDKKFQAKKPKEAPPVPQVTSEPDVKAYLEGVLWVDIRSDIAASGMKRCLDQAICNLRFSGGNILPESVRVTLETGQVSTYEEADKEFAAYLRDYRRSAPSKGPVYLYTDRLDALSEPNEHNASERLVEFLRFLAKRHRQNEDLNDKHAYEGEYLGHMVAMHNGYRLLETPVVREGTRLADDIGKILAEGRYDPLDMKDEGTRHAFAESTLSLVGLTSLRRISAPQDDTAIRCIWAPVWYSDTEYQVRSVTFH